MGRSEQVVLRIARQDEPGSARYWQSFPVPYEPGMNVITALQHVAENPRPLGSDDDVPPVAWDCNCLEEICGACTMIVNGRVRQACSALIDGLAATDSGEIILEPMTKFPVMRDLVVDRRRMFRGLTRISGWIPVDGYHDAGPGPRQSPEDQEEAYPLSECMSCGCCLEACPQYTKLEIDPLPGETDRQHEARSDAEYDRAFVGPAVISQVVYFNGHPTGRMTGGARLETLMGPGGISDCGNAQNCVKVCPKEIPLTRSIARAGRDTTFHAIGRWLSR